MPSTSSEEEIRSHIAEDLGALTRFNDDVVLRDVNDGKFYNFVLQFFKTHVNINFGNDRVGPAQSNGLTFNSSTLQFSRDFYERTSLKDCSPIGLSLIGKALLGTSVSPTNVITATSQDTHVRDPKEN